MSKKVESENYNLPSKNLLTLFNGLNNLWTLVHHSPRKPEPQDVVEFIKLARKTQHQAHAEELEIKVVDKTNKRSRQRRYTITGKNMDW